MIKELSCGLVIFAGFVCLPGALSRHQTELLQTPTPAPAPSASAQVDRRLLCLQRFFAQADCPAFHLADVFLQAADDNHLDWRLLPSLSFVETGGGKAASNNNLFGWDCGRARFDSFAAGIHQVGFHLAHRSLYRHKNVAQILAVYNPNPDYGQLVTSVMRQIAPTE